MSILVIDFETTGLSSPDPIQFGSVLIPADWKDELEWDYTETLILPTKEVEWGAMGVHGITNEFIQENYDVKWEDLKDNGYWVGESVQYLVSHNAQYDLQFIPKDQIDRVKVVCTLKLARLLIDKSLCGDHKNSTLYYYLGCYNNPYAVEHLSKSHTALHDCVITANVLLAMLNKFNLTIEQAYDMINRVASDEKEKAFTGDITICNFPKHKGIKWKDVIKKDRDYVVWLVNAGKVNGDEQVAHIKKLLKQGKQE